MPEPEVPARRLPSGPPSIAARNAVMGFLMVCVIAAWGGDLFLGNLVKQHPLVFIALNARNRNLVLASPHLDAWSFYTVAFLRLLVSDPLFFILGRWYGDAGVRWMERKTPTYGKMMREAEGWFSKAAYPLVAIAPNNFICLFAGASGMSVPGFFAVNMVGTGIRLYILRVVGDVFSHQIKGLTGWITDHRLIIFAISALILGYTIWSERRAAGKSELGQLAHLDEEIAEAKRAGSGPAAASAAVDEALTPAVDGLVAEAVDGAVDRVEPADEPSP